MAITGIVPGATGTFVERPLPAGSVQPTGVIAAWTSSDPTNAPVTVAADGITASVAIQNPTPITSFTLTASKTLPDGSVVTSGPVTIPILPPPVTSLEIDQTA